MAKTNAQRCKESRARRKALETALDQTDLLLPMPAGTRHALDQLMAWTGHSDPREALSTAIHRLHAAGAAASAPYFAVSRHEITISAKASRQLDIFGQRQRAVDDAAHAAECYP